MLLGNNNAAATLKTINNKFFLFFEVIKVKVNMVIEINSHVCSQLSLECTKTAVELCF